MSERPYEKYICDACGFIYDEEKGDLDSGLPAGTRYADIPEDWECPLCGLNKAELRLLPKAKPRPQIARPTGAVKKKSAANRGSTDHVVIIGAGVAGWSAAEAIRDVAPDQPILLVSACEGLVYPKPALSMAIAQGKQAEDLVEQDAQTKAEELGIDVRTGTRVIKIDPKKQRITTAKGGVQYGKLILALGAHQRRLPVTGDAAESIISVNDLAAYKKMRAVLDGGPKKVVILGAGLIGSEFAEDLSSAGHGVTLVDPADQHLSNLIPAEMSETLKKCLSAKGVEFRFQTTLASLESSEAGYVAQLSTGEQLETDLVISAAGLIANTSLAEKAGLQVSKGIRVNRSLTTTDPNIFSLGDCAEIDGIIYAYIEPIRRQAKVIASVIVNTPQEFDSQPPLIRVKTPSSPMSIQLPNVRSESLNWERQEGVTDGAHWQLRIDGKPVGFALSGSAAKNPAAAQKLLF